MVLERGFIVFEAGEGWPGFWVRDPAWDDTPAKYSAGPFDTRDEAQRFADACNRNARLYYETTLRKGP